MKIQDGVTTLRTETTRTATYGQTASQRLFALQFVTGEELAMLTPLVAKAIGAVAAANEALDKLTQELAGVTLARIPLTMDNKKKT
jgi:hypothetical protein